MQTKEYLQSVVDYIEDNIHETLTVEELSDVVGFSRFYLHRIFSLYSGMSLKEYVRKRKLSRAMTDLKDGRRIIDFAYSYSYGSERAFSRAFVNEFGHSPSYYRKNPIVKGSKLIIRDLSLTLSDGDVIVLDFKKFKLEELNHLKREGVKILMEYLSKIRYETMKKMTVISGIRKSTNPEEEIIEAMNGFAAEAGIAPVRKFGFDSPVSEAEMDQGMRGYEFWLVVDEAAVAVFDECASENGSVYKGVELNKKEIPSYRYASLRIKDPFLAPFERIPAGWKVLVKWLEDNNFDGENFDHPESIDCMEEVIEVDGVTCMDIFIPVDRG